MNQQIFRKDDYICIVNRDMNEPIEQFIERGIFISRQKAKTDQEYDKIIKYSRIYINVKFYKCGYSTEIMNELDRLSASI